MESLGWSDALSLKREQALESPDVSTPWTETWGLGFRVSVEFRSYSSFPSLSEKPPKLCGCVQLRYKPHRCKLQLVYRVLAVDGLYSC